MYLLTDGITEIWCLSVTLYWIRYDLWDPDWSRKYEDTYITQDQILPIVDNQKKDDVDATLLLLDPINLLFLSWVSVNSNHRKLLSDNSSNTTESQDELQ